MVGRGRKKFFTMASADELTSAMNILIIKVLVVIAFVFANARVVREFTEVVKLISAKQLF